MKAGFFLDEIYSFGLSNSHYAPFLKDVQNGNITGKILKREVLEGYTSAIDNPFDYGSVYYNQTQDVHPPLYYFILHTVSSISGIGLSKWLGVGINFIFYMLTIGSLFYLSDYLLRDLEIALTVSVLYGLSTWGLSTVLYIRMYMLLTLFTVCFAVLLAKALKENAIFLYPLIAIVVFLGLMTHYYFLFYSFFACLIFDIYALVKKQYKKILCMSFSALLGAVSMYCCYPVCLIHLTKRTGGGTTVTAQLQDVSRYFGKFYGYGKQIFKGAFVPIVVGIFCVFAICVMIKKYKINLKTKYYVHTVIIVLPAFLAFAAVIVLSEVSARYAYNLLPIFVLTVGYVLAVYKKMAEALHSVHWVTMLKRVLVPACILASVLSAVIIKPGYLYEEYVSNNRMIQQHSAAPCIYITENINPSITSDLAQLLYFDEVYVCSASNEVWEYSIYDYLKKKVPYDEAVVYIADYGADYDCEMILSDTIAGTKFEGYELLWSGDFSTVYLMHS